MPQLGSPSCTSQPTNKADTAMLLLSSCSISCADIWILPTAPWQSSPHLSSQKVIVNSTPSFPLPNDMQCKPIDHAAIRKDLLKCEKDLDKKLLTWSSSLSLPQGNFHPITRPTHAPTTANNPPDLATTVESFTQTLDTTIHSVDHLSQVLHQVAKALTTIHTHILALLVTEHILDHKVTLTSSSLCFSSTLNHAYSTST